MSTQALQRPNAPPVLDCGIPIDCQYFDRATIVPLPVVGATAVLARVELPPQYCGILEFFCQYTDLFGRDPSEVLTPGLTWQLRANGQPLSPYHQLNLILNPWGCSNVALSMRMPEGSTVELIARRTGEAVASAGKQITLIGGRLLGRYWYNAAYGSA